MEIYIYKRQEDNGLSVFYPDYSYLKKIGLSVEEAIKKAIPNGVSYRKTTIDKLPKDRYFRDAWTDDNPTDTVDVDMNKARNIQMGYIREKRNKELKKLDIEFNKALERNDDLEKSRISAKKQILRDLPNKFDLSSYASEEALKNAWPEELKE